MGEKGIKQIVDTIPQKRLANVEEIAKTVIFLCSEHNTYITGQNITVDGDLPVHNFDIKSIFRNYQVEFIDNSPAVLKDEIKNGDVIIMDQRLKALHPLIIESIPENILCIDIEAGEKK